MTTRSPSYCSFRDFFQVFTLKFNVSTSATYLIMTYLIMPWIITIYKLWLKFTRVLLMPMWVKYIQQFVRRCILKKFPSWVYVTGCTKRPKSDAIFVTYGPQTNATEQMSKPWTIRKGFVFSKSILVPVTYCSYVGNMKGFGRDPSKVFCCQLLHNYVQNFKGKYIFIILHLEYME